eukprot:m.31339 g.31339  ORF g.31339 m.31339 type:complete len:268 (-) comp9410_c0_seq1:340-1143(-)
MAEGASSVLCATVILLVSICCNIAYWPSNLCIGNVEPFQVQNGTIIPDPSADNATKWELRMGPFRTCVSEEVPGIPAANFARCVGTNNLTAPAGSTSSNGKMFGQETLAGYLSAVTASLLIIRFVSMLVFFCSDDEDATGMWYCIGCLVLVSFGSAVAAIGNFSEGQAQEYNTDYSSYMLGMTLTSIECPKTPRILLILGGLEPILLGVIGCCICIGKSQSTSVSSSSSSENTYLVEPKPSGTYTRTETWRDASTGKTYTREVTVSV